jgi:dTDP-4-amino-4,6-dideoxygalactose transaminase
MAKDKKIWLSPPHMGGEEIKFVNEAFDSNWISPVGPHIDLFEKELADYNSIANCAVLSSGTAAIHLALILLGVKQGDEVLCSTFTFSGSCNPIAYQKSVPVFVDSEPTTWNMDPVLLEEAIVDRQKKTGKIPKALILVHLYGMPAMLKEILAISVKYNIPVIEDAAEALGSSYAGQKLGSFGDLGIYSFNGNKIITTSGGGALVSKKADWIKRAKFLSTQARDEALHYEHSEIGYNYRLSNVCAAIGRGQLKVLEDRVAKKRMIFEWYKKNLNASHYHFLDEPAGFFSNRWLTTVLISPDAGFTPERICLGLAKENIESRPLWKPMHLQPIFKRHPAYVNGNAEKFFKSGVCLPSGSNLTSDDQERIINGILMVTNSRISA